MATILNEYPALVAGVSALILAILGYLFNRWNSTHNKNLEIEKKEYDRRAAIHDTRIKEALVFVDTWDRVTDILLKFFVFKRLSKSNDEFDKSLDFLKTLYGDLDSLFKEATRKETSFWVLDDKELTDSLEKLESIYKVCLPLIYKYSSMALNDIEFSVKDIIELNKIIDFLTTASKIIVQMKTRLDILARTVP